MNIKRFWKWQYIIPAAIVMVPLAIALFVFVAGGIVMLLWNWLLPPLFGWPQITFWQALGLLALSRILFGGFGLRGSGRSNFRRRMVERWEHMTPEERERFQQGMRGRCGFGPSSSESEGQPG